MKLLQTLSLLASLFLILANNKVQSQDDDTSFQIDSFDPDPETQKLIYQGDAHVPSGAAYLRLTRTDSSGNTQGHSVGRVLYSPPVKFWEPGRQANFETTIRFFITPPSNNNPADGLVFFIVPVDFPIGDSGGNFGVFNSDGTAPNVFAVELDIYVDSWDPSFRHIGIDITSRDSVVVGRLDKAYGEPVYATINYDVNTRRISVVATVSSQNYTVSYQHDLKTVVPQQVRVGISAATGENVALHDILLWHFKSTLVDDLVFEDTYIKQVV